MEIAIISLLIVAVLLLIFSFFQKDPSKDIEKQVENFSISLMQEILKLKKKIGVLEEELMLPKDRANKNKSQKG